ncbi:hypothetical protein SynWH8101_1329 [Synechococcus sp. WH 8101]|uniref:hypothetical protein n=1 Tax=Synechococcus sp. WH 8101 TaxID=59932 RepID=UPI0010235587|nr:hypothetical protein [Synechococcus sp. WH 8101]QBE68915.1 hypothetical protein SynWH8101_1329 [Synechococcus sp. WH 8101]QNI45144.1 nif11-like leader peptide domain protein [Synechococcus sp. WH 8101]
MSWQEFDPLVDDAESDRELRWLLRHHRSAEDQVLAVSKLGFRVLWPNESSRVCISDSSRTDAELQVELDLRHSHPRALDLVVERIEVVRR